ncbi:competence protein ComG [Lederbergia sp. NSJ-179]|uniref:competence type IV pilus major pilin ComGC n=1 Tax=Lederbergia sp. NSJ-179 TaxID=2931402 RepID=UPI001FD2A2A0|nr:competence protein ComG [Lederbergia sp. NSJ-179]
MLIVLLVISIILLITLPNVTKHNKNINNKGCDALVSMLQGQAQAYYMENNRYPQSLAELEEGQYIESAKVSCPDGSDITITNGKVKALGKGGS